MILGKIIKSNSHTDYVCEIYARTEVAAPPSPADYCLGTFVRIPVAGQPFDLVGLVYDTVLLNPEFGRLGPRLSGEAELAVFSPDYLNEKVTLVGIVAVGTLAQDGTARQGAPVVAATSDSLVTGMNDDEVWRFHAGNPSLRVEYVPQLLARGTPLIATMLRAVIARLRCLASGPAQQALLDVLADELVWQTQIGPMGGGR